MPGANALQTFYQTHPLMISSPFGGVEGCDAALLGAVFDKLEIDTAGKRTLDVGCGRGYTGEFIRARGGSYFGADFVLSGSGFPLAQADAQQLPFADASFDLVLCIDAMEHFPDIPAAMREFRRVLQPGGVWFLSAPNYGNVAGLVKRVYEGLGIYERNTWAPFRRWQPQELEQPVTGGLIRCEALRAGFRGVRRMGHGAEVGLGLFPWVDHPKMPEAVQFRLQRLFNALGPGIVRALPSASLHLFFRIDA